MQSRAVVVADVLAQRGAQRVIVEKGDAAREFCLERVPERRRMGVITRPSHTRTLALWRMPWATMASRNAAPMYSVPQSL